MKKVILRYFRARGYMAKGPRLAHGTLEPRGGSERAQGTIWSRIQASRSLQLGRKEKGAKSIVSSSVA